MSEKSLNKVFLLGRLGRDPETRFSQSGSQITTFNLALSRKWKGQDGDEQEKTTWVKITTFGNLAKICSDYLKKGSRVHVEGRLEEDTWEQEGNRRTKMYVVANDMTMFDGANKGERPRRDDGPPEDEPF